MKTIRKICLLVVLLMSFTAILPGAFAAEIRGTTKALKSGKNVYKVTKKAEGVIDLVITDFPTALRHRNKARLGLPENANISDDVLEAFNSRCRSGKITNEEFDYIIKESDEAKKIESIKNAAKGVDNAGKFTQAQIDEYVKFATQYPQENKVMLGMWDNGKPSSYVNKAGKEYTHFNMGDEWYKAETLVNGSKDEMWRINKQFIYEQYKAIPKKEFWFSHDPFSPTIDQYFSAEVLYLIDLGVKDFEKVGDLWRAVW